MTDILVVGSGLTRVVSRIWQRRYLGVAVALLLTACQPSPDPVHAALAARLKQDAKLTPDEIRQLVMEVGKAIETRKIRIRKGGLVQELEKDQRLEMFGLLAEPDNLYESDPRREGAVILRGLTANATPVLSEIDAMKTIWIDADTVLPVRYEFTYSVAGFGDYAYDLLIE